MKVSLNTIKQLTGIDMPLDELTSKINSQLGAIEEIVELGDKYKDALIVKVISADQHPNADRLKVCMVDDGGVREGVERNGDGQAQVVCGAPNVTAGMFAVWLPPNSTVPATSDDKEPFVLSARELRGVISQGMLAAGDELAINGDHDGIVEITQSDIADGGAELSPGLSFARTFGLDDTIIDIENKMFTHRPDLFGQLGLAREIFAISQPDPSSTVHNEDWFTEEEWYWRVPTFENADELKLNVFNDAPDSVSRFMAVAMQGVEIKPSPLWLQTTLVRWGSKPINNVVDLTNYIMLLTAQPTHAYDYDKLRGSTLGARMAKQGETVKLLNGKTYVLDKTDIVIADGEGPVGLAGIMGGGDSEVSQSTTNIVLEVATFDMYTVRKSSMRHGIFTDALTRFNKGQSYLQNDRVISRLIELIRAYSSAHQASDVIDLNSVFSDGNRDSIHGQIRYDSKFINERLGLNLTPVFIGNLLRFGHFATYKPDEGDDTTLETTAPFWRTDIEVPEDIVEEVGRLYGFDRLPRELPQRGIKPAAKNQRRELKTRIRESLSKAGANEVLSYSFVPGKLLEATEYDTKDAFKISNALSPDLQYYRPRVLPSLLDKVHPNIKSGHDEFALFEIGKGHNKNLPVDDEGLPAEPEFVELVYAAKKPRDGAAFYVGRRLLDQLAVDLGIELEYKPNMAAEAVRLYEPARSATVIDRNTGLAIGIVGEVTSSVAHKLKLPEYCAAVSIDFDKLLKASVDTGAHYRPLSRYPSVSQDVSLKVDAAVQYRDLLESVERAAEDIEDMVVDIAPRTVYQSKEDKAHKTVTLRLTVTSHERTLTDVEVGKIVDVISDRTAKDHGSETI